MQQKMYSHAIKAHRHKVVKKMKLSLLTELVSFAERVGILPETSTDGFSVMVLSLAMRQLTKKTVNRPRL
jgi:hypothetical protein